MRPAAAVRHRRRAAGSAMALREGPAPRGLGRSPCRSAASRVALQEVHCPCLPLRRALRPPLRCASLTTMAGASPATTTCWCCTTTRWVPPVFSRWRTCAPERQTSMRRAAVFPSLATSTIGWPAFCPFACLAGLPCGTARSRAAAVQVPAARRRSSEVACDPAGASYGRLRRRVQAKHLDRRGRPANHLRLRLLGRRAGTAVAPTCSRRSPSSPSTQPTASAAPPRCVGALRGISWGACAWRLRLRRHPCYSVRRSVRSQCRRFLDDPHVHRAGPGRLRGLRSALV
jgi:hypothetical protein